MPDIRPKMAERRWEAQMTAFNSVRMRVKPGREKDFLDLHKTLSARDMPGLRHFAVVRTGDRGFCVIGEWDSMDALAQSRPAMIRNLDAMRDMLEDLGGGLGVTDPVSGEAIVEFGAQT